MLTSLEVFYENALYKFTFDIDINMTDMQLLIRALWRSGWAPECPDVKTLFRTSYVAQDHVFFFFLISVFCIIREVVMYFRLARLYLYTTRRGGPTSSVQRWPWCLRRLQSSTVNPFASVRPGLYAHRIGLNPIVIKALQWRWLTLWRALLPYGYS